MAELASLGAVVELKGKYAWASLCSPFSSFAWGGVANRGELIGPKQQTEIATEYFDTMLGQTGDGGTMRIRAGGVTYFLSLARVYIHNVYL